MKKLSRKFWYGYFGSFWLLKDRMETKIGQFKKLKKISLIDVDLGRVRHVIMESIILDMGKIIGVTNADQTGIDKITQRLSSKIFSEYVEKLNSLKNKYKETFLKIKNNRNRIISHLDFCNKPYYEMKFSEDEVERMYAYSPCMFNNNEEYEKIKNEAKQKLVTEQKQDQRYAPVDLEKDAPIFESIIQKLSEIFKKINKIIVEEIKNI